MRNHIIMIALFSLSIIACQNDQKNMGSAEAEPIEDTPQLNSQSSPLIIDSVDMNAILTNGSWEVEIVLKNGQMIDDENWIGNTINFETGNNYTWRFDDKLRKGNWEFDSSSMLLSLENEDEDYSSQWNVKYRRGIMVWIGTAKYGHNTIQMKVKNI